MLRPTVIIPALAALALSACSLPDGVPFLDSGGSQPVVVVETTDQAELIAQAVVAAQERANATEVPLALTQDGASALDGSTATASADQYEAQFASMDAQNEAIEQQAAQLRWALQQARSENSSLEAQIAAMGGDAQAIASELSQKDALISQLQAQLNQADQQTREADSARVRALRSLDRAQAELEGQTAMIFQIEREMNHLQRRAAAAREAQAQVGELQRQLAHLQRRMGTLRDKARQAEELQDQVTRLQRRLAKAQAEAEAARKIAGQVGLPHQGAPATSGGQNKGAPAKSGAKSKSGGQSKGGARPDGGGRGQGNR